MDNRTKIENKNLDWLNPDDLIEFIDILRLNDYNIGISQYIAAQDLIIILISQDETFDSPESLRSLLAPIFCSSATEQAEFQHHFDNYFKSKSVNQSSSSTAGTTEKNKESLEEKKELKSSYRLLIILLIFIAFPTTIYTYLRFQESNNEIPIPRPTITPTLKPTTTPTLKPTITPTLIPTITPTLIPQCTGLSQNTINWPREIGFFLTPALVFFIIRMCWFWYTRRLFLQRYGTTTQPEIQNIFIPGFEQDLFPTITFMEIARNLRKRILILSPELDIEKTIDATIHQGGFLKRVYRNYQILPEYLFLVNRISFQDYQAQFMEEMIERLKQDNVLITSYFFDDDPLICFPNNEEGSPLRFDEIISKYSDHYLIIVSDTEKFFSIINGELEPWVNNLDNWENCAILTPKLTESWGYQELKIAEEFMIFPATSAGLQMLSQKLWTGENSKPDYFQDTLPQTLRIQTYRWLERNSPEPEQIETMLVSLQKYLDNDSFYWFCACAVFPELQWYITIYLGNVLKTEAGQSLLQVCSLNNLARLPWFRSGYIPDWLRVYLIKKLTFEQEQEIRTALQNLLNQANNSSEKGLKLLSIVTKLVKASEDSPLQDYLFLDFMTKPSPLMLKVPENFSQKLPKPIRKVAVNTQINRRRFLQIMGLGGAGFVAAVAGNQVFRSSQKTFSFDVVTVNSQGKIINRVCKQAKFFTEDLGNKITLDMVEIPAGSFMMGSPESEKGRSKGESPQHQVNVPAFAMGKFAVTQEQYQQIMGKNPARFKGAKRPVERVSWNDAVEFCSKLSQKTGRKYRLPSEAEWEYACRAGTTTPFHFGETITSDLANYNGSSTYASEPKGNYRQQTTDVGSFQVANAFGLYDMHGNVWEWCQDGWHNDYKDAPTNGSAWVSDKSKSYKLLRGGSWFLDPDYCRSAYRGWHDAGFDNYDDGFRVVCGAAWTL